MPAWIRQIEIQEDALTDTYRTQGPIIDSLLDTDWYKITMMQGVHHNYPNASVTWEFRSRNAEDLAPTSMRYGPRSTIWPP